MRDAAADVKHSPSGVEPWVDEVLGVVVEGDVEPWVDEVLGVVVVGDVELPLDACASPTNATNTHSFLLNFIAVYFSLGNAQKRWC